MSARHDDYKVDWRASRPGDPEPVKQRDECSWCVLALIGVAAFLILLASAWGYMQ